MYKFSDRYFIGIIMSNEYSPLKWAIIILVIVFGFLLYKMTL